MIVSKSHICPYRQSPHENLAYVEYENGHWCYSCNRGEFKDRSFKKNDDYEDLIINSYVDLPPNLTNNIKEFSNEALSWLYKYYVFEDLIRYYGIHYGNGILLFPINTKRGGIAAYQTRSLAFKHFSSSKYLKDYTFIASHILDHNVKKDIRTIVLVEDYISCIRVGEIHDCLWLVGTYLQDYKLDTILHNYNNIKIWLDGDEPGIIAAKKMYNKIYKEMLLKRPFSHIKIEIITTEHDPKCYTDTEIRQILEEGKANE